MTKKILLICTLDTKGREVDYLRQKVREKGCDVVVMDVGTLGEPLCRPDISQEEVAYAGGENFLHMKSKGSRSHSIEVITRGAINKTIELHSQEQLAGVLAIGGGTGTSIGTAVMRSLPLGIPKVMVSTVASRNVSPYVGTSDIVMFHSVVDLVGLNAITKMILDKAAGIIAGMTQSIGEITSIRPLVAATAFGICTMTAALAEPILAEKGYEMVTFHANGAGGRALEQLISQGLFSGVLDFVTHELADQLYNGYCGDIGPDRLTTAVKKGVPMIITPGGLDCIVFKSIDDVPQKLRQRKIYHHDIRVAVRISEEELSKIARTIAERVVRPKGPVGILIPLMGWSELDRQGGFAFEPQLVYSFTKHLKAVLPPGVSLQEIDCHISDPRFAKRAVEWLDTMVRG